LPAQERSVFAAEGCGDHIPPDTSRRANFQLAADKVAFHRAGNNQALRLQCLAVYLSALANHNQPLHRDIPVHCALDAHPTLPAQIPGPDNARSDD
jgi:hypothetical protein